MTRREDTLLEETLYEEELLPVCSPALLADWSYWFARQGESTPDLSRASGFRLYSMLVQAAVHGIGAAIGRPMLIARELEIRTLVPLFDRQSEAPERCCLITTAASRQRPEVRAFREWVLDEALLHDSTAARVEALFQLLVQDTTAQNFGLPSSAIRLRM